MPNCYICGAENADSPLALKESFTGHPRCKAPTSDKLCQTCFDCIDGKFKQVWYWHPTKEKWSKLWGRNWSWLVCNDDSKSRPQFKPSDKNDGLLEVTNLPTRAEIKEWLINPPSPPFTVCIAISGQKHTYPFRVESQSRELFPVLMEETLIYIDRPEFTQLLNDFESLMGLGFSKTEITSGDYRSDRLAKCLAEWREIEARIEKYRGTDLMALADHVGGLTTGFG